LFIKFIIPQAETASITQIRDQIIHFCAFFVFSSFQAETRYITQLNIKAKTAITAVSQIPSCIILQKAVNVPLPFCQGNQLSIKTGVAQYTLEKTKVNKAVNNNRYFLTIIYNYLI
jgi:hypothetical protein